MPPPWHHHHPPPRNPPRQPSKKCPTAPPPPPPPPIPTQPPSHPHRNPPPHRIKKRASAPPPPPPPPPPPIPTKPPSHHHPHPSRNPLRPTTAAEAPSPPPTAAEANQDTHLRNILDALVGSGDYGGWANLLSSANPADLPLTATLFVPSNDALSAPLDPLLVAYHIVPQRFTFSQLRRLTPTRLPTLLPSNSILLAGNSPDNFTLDASHITHPDIFLNSAFAVHGLDRLLNYSVYGSSRPLSLAPESGDDVDVSLQRRPRPHPPKPRRSPPPPPGSWVPDIPDVTAPGPKAGAWRACGGIPAVVISCFFVFFRFMVR
ncbi:pollen-specific leucine-rich repeat extensin-like protein 2 [Salvia hispanica]|uniref:pollen-specific leucine-rich repeat extensin-like protein 2 n=1 Tax=Salvia hispanica TaxID=49212 RepID=UPI002009A0C0|nr:pollen-specific leucine-rich repeat extensin-like protein 2 [Salvia hispanica]